MSDRRQVLRALLLGSAGLAVPSLAGCGVPGGGNPVVDGPGPSAGTGRTSYAGTPPGPDGVTDPIELVQNYLLAVAGPLEEEYTETAQKSARRFMTAGLKAEWQPDKYITVVQVGALRKSDGSTSTFVDGVLQPVGQLGSSGMLTPPEAAPPPLSCKFELVVNPDKGGGWRIKAISSPQDKNIANRMLLSSRALDVDLGLGLYTPQLLYYWYSSTRDGLVPDLRYLPAADVPQKQLIRIVNELLSDPPDWLVANSWASLKPVGTGVNYSAGNPLGVNILTPVPDPDRFMTALRWSLWPVYQGRVQLEVNSQAQRVDGGTLDFKKWNLADAQRSNDEFCVAGGVVRPLDSASTPAVLNTPLNLKVIWAALSRDKHSAALVREAGPGRYGLWLGDVDTAPTYIQVTGLPSKTTNIGRPVWLPAEKRVLVLADNHLYTADLGGRASDLTPSWADQITAFSVAPDGRRIALIVDGGLALAALSPTGIGSPRRLTVPVLQKNTLTAIAWTRMDRVAIAGRISGAQNSLVEMTIDGAVVRQFPEVNLSAEIVHLAAFPAPPSTPNAGMSKVLGQSGRDLKAAFSFDYTPSVDYTPRGRYDRLPDLQVTPSPTPSSSPGHPQAVTPTAPFYAD
jgi:hypothetical protein